MAFIQNTPTAKSVPVGVVPSAAHQAPAVPAAHTEEAGGVAPVLTLSAAKASVVLTVVASSDRLESAIVVDDAALGILLVVKPEIPPPEYCGIFRVLVPWVQVAAPLLPVVVSVIGRLERFDAFPLDGVPRTGVTNVGLVANTKAPLPVSLVTAAARFAEEGVPRKVAIPVPNPVTPVEIGKPVALVSTPALGVPISGVTRAGDVAKTSAPEPVSLVTAVARLALEGVPKNVAIPVPSPLTPVLIGNPVMLVATPEVGVPNRGAIKVIELNASEEVITVPLSLIAVDWHPPEPSEACITPAAPPGTHPVPPPPPAPPLIGDGLGVCAESPRASVRPQSRRR